MISPSLFRNAFDRFQFVHKEASGSVLNSFNDRQSFAYGWEGYKNAIPDRAMAVMEPKIWKRSMIGTGEITAKVIQAIELPGNNLLEWAGRYGPLKRVHSSLISARVNPAARKVLEPIFWNLYRNQKADEATFEAIVDFCGRKYELLSYLFFIAAADRFLPLRTQSFDRALEELGIDLRTSGQCGWENYRAFIEAMIEVQKCLHAEGMTDASLLDAHSFCWILARHPAEEISVIVDAPTVEAFDGLLQIPSERGTFKPKDDADTRNMFLESLKRQASGLIAEEIALVSEMKRLRQEGRPDLAEQVTSVADQPGLGYDIRSFEDNGDERFIEVKNVSKSNRFFLSEGEWLNSRDRPNY